MPKHIEKLEDKVLYVVHAFTGCDTVSACAGRGKMRIFKHVKTNKTYEEAFCWLGRTWDVSAELFQKLQETRHSVEHGTRALTALG